MNETDQEILDRIRNAGGFAPVSLGETISSSPREDDAAILARLRGAGAFVPTTTNMPAQPPPLSMFPATLGGPAGALTPVIPGPPPSPPKVETPKEAKPETPREHAPGIQFGTGAVLALTDLFSIGANLLQGVAQFGMPGAGGFEIPRDAQGKLIRPESPEFFGSKVAKAAREWAERVGLGEPPNGWENLERKLGEEFGAALPFYLGILRHGRRLEKAGEIAPFLPKLFQHAGRAPKLFTAEEAVGVAGTALGRIMVRDDHPLAQAIMGTAGGVTGSLGFQTLATLGRGSRFLWDLASSVVPEERAIARAAQLLQQGTGEAGRELAIRTLDRYRRQGGMRGVRPTLGAVTGDYGVQSLEHDLAVRYPDFNLRLRMAQQEGNPTLIRDLISRGKYYGDPVEEARLAASAHLEAEKDAIRRRLFERIPVEDRDPETLSELFRAELQRIHDAIYEPLDNRYNELTAIMDELEEEFSTAPLKRAVRRLREFEGFAPPAPGREEAIQVVSGEAPENIISQINNLPDNAPASIIHSYRRILRDAVRDSAPDQQRHRKLLGILLDGVEEAMEDIKQIGFSRRRSPELREVAEELDVLDAEFREYARVFRETREQGITTTGRILSKHGPAATAMLSQYAKPGLGSVERLRNFKDAFRGNTAAMEAMEDYLVFEAYQTCRDKLGNPTKSLAVFKRRYRKQLQAFPKAAERIRSLERLGEEAKALGIYGPTTNEAIRRGAVKLFIDDPVKAMTYILGIPGEQAQKLTMQQLLKKTAGNPEAKNGLRQLLWEQLTDKAIIRDKDTQALMVSGANIHKFLSKNKGAFEALYSPEELRSLEELARTSDMMSQIRVARVQRGQDQPERAMEFIQKSGWWRPIWSTKLKLIRSMRAASLLSRELTEAQSENILLEALVNPTSRLSRTLLSEINPNARRFLVNWLSKNIPTLGPRLQLQSENNRTALPGG